MRSLGDDLNRRACLPQRLGPVASAAAASTRGDGASGLNGSGVPCGCAALSVGAAARKAQAWRNAAADELTAEWRRGELQRSPAFSAAAQSFAAAGAAALAARAGAAAAAASYDAGATSGASSANGASAAALLDPAAVDLRTVPVFEALQDEWQVLDLRSQLLSVWRRSCGLALG